MYESFYAHNVSLIHMTKKRYIGIHTNKYKMDC